MKLNKKKTLNGDSVERHLVIDGSEDGFINLGIFNNQEDLENHLDKLSRAAGEEAERTLAFVETPMAKDFLEHWNNRPPLHLIPGGQLFIQIGNYYPFASSIKDLWLEKEEQSSYPVDPLNFLVGYLVADTSLGKLWNQLASVEARYLELWTRVNARDRVGIKPFISTPKSSIHLLGVLELARDEFKRAYQEQKEDDPRFIYLYNSILFYGDTELLKLLEELKDTRDWFSYSYDEIWKTGSLHFPEFSGPGDSTCKAAGYKAAVEVLRNNGIPCEQWAYWD